MKTVSWYLHTFLASYARLVVVTPDRMQREMCYSQALNNYCCLTDSLNCNFANNSTSHDCSQNWHFNE